MLSESHSQGPCVRLRKDIRGCPDNGEAKSQLGEGAGHGGGGMGGPQSSDNSGPIYHKVVWHPDAGQQSLLCSGAPEKRSCHSQSYSSSLQKEMQRQWDTRAALSAGISRGED